MLLLLLCLLSLAFACWRGVVGMSTAWLPVHLLLLLLETDSSKLSILRNQQQRLQPQVLLQQLQWLWLDMHCHVLLLQLLMSALPALPCRRWHSCKHCLLSGAAGWAA
jgi:hypothetical protein